VDMVNLGGSAASRDLPNMLYILATTYSHDACRPAPPAPTLHTTVLLSYHVLMTHEKSLSSKTLRAYALFFSVILKLLVHSSLVTERRIAEDR
jgi:hypothetical protein